MQETRLPNPLDTDGIEGSVHGDEQAVFGLCLNCKDAIPVHHYARCAWGDSDRQHGKTVGAGGSSSSSHAVPDDVQSCCCSTIGTEGDRTETAHDVCRITVNPAQMEGVLCIQGSRIPIATVVGMVADSMSTPEISTPIQTSMGLLRKGGELFLNEEVFHAQSAETFYARHIRDEAVRLAVMSGRTRREIAEDLGSSTLRHWMDRRWECWIEQPPWDRQEDVAAELKPLRRENEILRQERDILKRATAFFAKEGSR